VAACSDVADLFIVGADFYSGSVGKSLKNGWCDFEALGQDQAQERFGNNWRLGRVWYMAERVPKDALRGFEEHDRQNTWLKAQGAKVVRVVIDSKQLKKSHPPLVAGEFSFRREADAIDAIRGSALAPAAMVISTGNEQASLLTFLDERYRQQQKILLPPESEVDQIAGKHRLEHSDLEAARLAGYQNDELWNSYLSSRDHKTVVAHWLAKISDSEVRRWLHKLLNDLLPRSPKDFLTNAPADPKILAKALSRIDPYLEAHPNDNHHLARDRRCSEFIARSLIKVVADDVFGERFGPEPEQRPSIRNGLDLIAQADRMYPKIEICEVAERQIRAMTGTEKYFCWVLDALDTANREMLAWNGGPFPHHMLPGKPAPESGSVMNNRRLRAMRCFRTRRGEDLPFEWHMKHKAENQRIHYLVDPKRSRLLMIGYVGPHLPTPTYPTF
jgi:hypothetical protein